MSGIYPTRGGAGGAAANVITVRKNSGADVGTRSRLNLIEGTNIGITATDDAGSTEVDVTLAFAGVLPIASGGTGQTTAITAFNALSPLTTKGDLVVNDGTNDVRLPVGANGLILTADSAEASGVKWASAPVGGGSAGTIIVRKNSGTDLTARPRVNFIEGTGVALTVADDGVGNEVDITIALSGGAPITVRKNSGADVGTRPRLNLIEGANIALGVTDDGAGGEVDITVAITGAVAIANGGTGQTSKTPAFDALAPGTTKGDLIVHDGSDNIRFAAGTNGHVLTADSGVAAGMKWAAATPLTTKGDLVIFTTQVGRLPVGTDGQVLLADSVQASGLRWGAVTGMISGLTAGRVALSGPAANQVQDNARLAYSTSTETMKVPNIDVQDAVDLAYGVLECGIASARTHFVARSISGLQLTSGLDAIKIRHKTTGNITTEAVVLEHHASSDFAIWRDGAATAALRYTASSRGNGLDVNVAGGLGLRAATHLNLYDQFGNLSGAVYGASGRTEWFANLWYVFAPSGVAGNRVINVDYNAGQHYLGRTDFAEGPFNKCFSWTNDGKISFLGMAPTINMSNVPVITGVRPNDGNNPTILRQILLALAAYGLVIDSTTAALG